MPYKSSIQHTDKNLVLFSICFPCPRTRLLLQRPLRRRRPQLEHLPKPLQLTRSLPLLLSDPRYVYLHIKKVIYACHIISFIHRHHLTRHYPPSSSHSLRDLSLFTFLATRWRISNRCSNPWQCYCSCLLICRKI